MKMPGSVGMILLAVYLILLGTISLIPGLGGLAILLPYLAILSGILILIGR